MRFLAAIGGFRRHVPERVGSFALMIGTVSFLEGAAAAAQVRKQTLRLTKKRMQEIMLFDHAALVELQPQLTDELAELAFEENCKLTEALLALVQQREPQALLHPPTCRTWEQALRDFSALGTAPTHAKGAKWPAEAQCEED